MPGVLAQAPAMRSAVSRALPTCQAQTLRSGSSTSGAARGSLTAGSSSPDVARMGSKEVLSVLVPLPACASSLVDADLGAPGATMNMQAAASLSSRSSLSLQRASAFLAADDGMNDDDAGSDEDCVVFDARAAAEAAASAAAAAKASAVVTSLPVHGMDASAGACTANLDAATSRAGSSACSAASSVVFSGPCASSAASASCRFPSTLTGAESGPLAGRSSASCLPHHPSRSGNHQHPASSLEQLPSFANTIVSTCSSSRRSLRDQNSVTIKATTVVKDAAGAIDKILARGVTALVTALRAGSPPYNTSYDSLNQAVKAIAVARQYARETGPAGAEVTFMPFHRHDGTERPDPARFGFLVFPLPRLAEPLKTADETVLNVARGSDVHKMAGAIIAVMLDRGQAVMKAAGADAIFVAMSAVVSARHRLVTKHGFDLMLAAAWITEDTVATMGRESKFLRFNILKTQPAGPRSAVAPSLPAGLEASAAAC